MHILLRSGWQSVNIGDVAHTLAFISFAEKHLPGVKITVWVSWEYSQEAIDREYKLFPHIKVLKGKALPNGVVTNPELERAIDDCDFLLHNSGPMLVAKDDVVGFVNRTGKPFGVFGITYDGNEYYSEILSKAAFLYFRDSRSLAIAREKFPNVKCEFGPDIAFAMQDKDLAWADRFLAEHGLEAGKFVCCIARMRHTPFWLIKPQAPYEDFKEARNEETKDHDHQMLVETIVQVVRQTDHKVLVCPEDASQMAISRDQIMAKLPEDVLSRVVWMSDIWLTDEALGVYSKCACLFGNEMHSPILCIANGVPAIVCRCEEQTSKGIMWDDIGLSEWLFDLDDDAQLAKLPQTVLGILQDPAAAKAKAEKALRFVREKQDAMARTLLGMGERDG